MTKNEEKAIEILKNTRQAWCRILSRYIDKQQKEIEELNTELEIRIKWQQYFEKEYVNKDKIRKLIAKYTLINNSEHIKGMYTKEILALKELLEEN